MATKTTGFDTAIGDGVLEFGGGILGRVFIHKDRAEILGIGCDDDLPLQVGGELEPKAAMWIKEHGTKPVVGFIAGETAPKGRTMGHAGAIVSGENESASAKKRIMRECGIHVVDSPAEIGAKMAEVLLKK